MKNTQRFHVYNNRDNRKLAEVTDFCRKLRTLDPVCGAENVGAFALIKDYVPDEQ